MATTIVTKKGSGAPAASDLVEGELAVDTTNGRLYTENSSAAVVELGSNPSGNITFGDNGKAIFGAGSDLEIYHTGSDSRILDNGTGNLRIMANNLRMQSALGEQYIIADDGGAVTLYNDNTARLATTSSGIDITGSVTADGLTVDGGADGSTSYARFTEYSSGYGFNGAYASYKGSSNELIFGRHNTFDSLTANDIPVMSIARSTGDISFYEDTGTTPKFFWDASAESLTITGNSNAWTIDNTTIYGNRAGGSIYVGNSSATGEFGITSGGAVVMQFDASGNVGIGTVPIYDLDILDTSETILGIRASDSSGTNVAVRFQDAGTGTGVNGLYVGRASALNYFWTYEAEPLLFGTSATERMRIDASGNLLVGKAIADNTTQGIRLLGSAGFASFVRDSAEPIVVNRLTNDGDLIEFRKDGAAVGSIGTTGGGIYLGSPSGAGKYFANNSNFSPSTDGSKNLGDSSLRWQDLYQSGTAYALAYRAQGTIPNGNTGLVTATSSTASDLALAGMAISKYDNNQSTSQVFFRFLTNQGATANGQIVGNGSSQATFGAWSDSRLKENITDLPNQLANITALRPVEFDYIESEGGGHQLGFIAQEVEEIYPDLVGEREDGMKTLAGMGKMEARLIKAIQEQQATIEALTARIAALES